MWQEIKEQILNGEDHETYLVNAVYNFQSCVPDCKFNFDDFFVDGCICEKFTYHFLWCLHAIVYAIKLYDVYKKVKGN